MGTVLKETDIFLPDQNFFTQVLNKHYTEEHAHECYELFYVLSGNATHYVNGVRSEIKQNDLILIRPYKYHLFTFVGSKNFCHRDLLVRRELFENILAESPASFREYLQSRDYVSTALTSEQLQYLEKEITAITAPRERESRDFMTKTLFFSIISTLLPQNTATPPPVQDGKPLPFWMSQLLTQMHYPPHFRYSQQELLQVLPAFQYNISYVSRMFRHYMGVTFTEYRNKIRFDTAHSLLQTTNLSIEDIIVYVGLNSRTYFYREFKKRYGLSPNRVRHPDAVENEQEFGELAAEEYPGNAENT